MKTNLEILVKLAELYRIEQKITDLELCLKAGITTNEYYLFLNYPNANFTFNFITKIFKALNCNYLIPLKNKNHDNKNRKISRIVSFRRTRNKFSKWYRHLFCKQ